MSKQTRPGELNYESYVQESTTTARQPVGQSAMPQLNPVIVESEVGRGTAATGTAAGAQKVQPGTSQRSTPRHHSEPRFY